MSRYIPIKKPRNDIYQTVSPKKLFYFMVEWEHLYATKRPFV